METTMTSQRRSSDTDIVRTYYKQKNGTMEPSASKKWLNSLEENILLFLGKLFHVKGFDTPLKNASKPMELQICAKNNNLKDEDIALYK